MRTTLSNEEAKRSEKKGLYKGKEDKRDRLLLDFPTLHCVDTVHSIYQLYTTG